MMKKLKIIKEIVVTKLKPYGFSFMKQDGPCYFFSRKIKERKRYYDPGSDEVKQIVIFQENRFAKKWTVRFETDVANYLVGQDLEILRELNKDDGTKWFDYFDEQSLINLLNFLSDVVIEYGLDFLDSMSEEEYIIPTKAMAIDLYDNYGELDNNFIEEFKFDKQPKNVADIDDWFEDIKRIIINLTDKPYEDVKTMLIKIAAFIGQRNCEILDQEWFYDKEKPLSTPGTTPKKDRGMVFYPLKTVVGYYREYKYKNANIYWFYNEIMELKRVIDDNIEI